MRELSEPTDLLSAHKLVEKIGHYNEFRWPLVNFALNRLEMLNGRPLAIRVGREYSPVIYIDNIRFRLTVEEVQIREIFGEAYASKIDIVAGGTLRVWWD